MSNPFVETTDPEMFTELLSAVRGIQQITISQQPAFHVPFTETTEVCPRLVHEAGAISNSATRQPEQVDTQKVKETWERFNSNPDVSSLTGRDYKRFCWVPEIVANTRFRELVISRHIPVTIPSLRGLLYSYHARFREVSSDDLFTARIRELIRAKSVANSSIKSWNDAADCLLGVHAPVSLATKAARQWIAPEKQLELLELNSTTEFAEIFASTLAEIVASEFEALPSDGLSEILDNIFGSSLVSRQAFKSALSEAILSRRANSDESVQAILIDFLLKGNGLGDPRINPENWVGLDESAKTRVIEWLSREDINFFFELLLRDRDDKHGRKSFWLQYVDKVSRSRALISSEHRQRHAVRLREMEKKGRSYAELNGSSSSSAFVLDFGRIVVVEFSEVGNACYIYEKSAFSELFPEFWAKAFPAKHLKNQELVAERITRSIRDWQSSARQILSRFGVRRG